MKTTSKFLRSIGPAIPVASPVEALRAGLGALIGLGVAGLFVLSPSVDLKLGLYLIAPFGASAVLLFAVPNSPLAQPWSAVVGNMIAAVIGVAVCLSVPDPAPRIALAVALTIAAMVLCRAVHPPAGAVAMTAAMNPDAVAEMGFRFALAPVAAGTVLLVVIAIIYARLTGRHYPFRQFDDDNTHGTSDPSPFERLGLSEEELTGILDRYRQTLNLGVEDLARLIGAAEMQAATHQTGPLVAADIMSRDLVTVGPKVDVSEIADLFLAHRFTSLPVVDTDDKFLGIIFQMHLISNAHNRDATAQAHDIMDRSGPRATPETSIATLLFLMSEGEVDAVPVLEQDRITGIVTRTDMIAALARTALRNG
ncbi:HPP family protein [Litoreibacter arenae]|uniref:CBS-domain-containing membrane protein n=1 Tax=Litoreibacter arenae DSM 19593 TaxID=1123360 RepID=S9RZ59_9RHOB|nr:HPP family protein [Litoreibacter arenae]EPX79264.1 CBS-domain-containing membrane protein [Litoreibacter arenae DSM 19593]